MSEQFSVTTDQPARNVVRLALRGELDLAVVDTLRSEFEKADAIVRAASTDGEWLMIVDLSALEFIDSSGLRSVLDAQKRMGDAGGDMMLVRGPLAVERAFEVTGLGLHFKIVDDARAVIRQRGPASAE